MEKKKQEITKKMSITEIIEKSPESIAVFMKHGFHCLGCVAAQFETLEDGAAAHGIDADMLVKEINKAAGKAKPSKQKI